MVSRSQCHLYAPAAARAAGHPLQADIGSGGGAGGGADRQQAPPQEAVAAWSSRLASAGPPPLAALGPGPGTETARLSVSLDVWWYCARTDFAGGGSAIARPTVTTAVTGASTWLTAGGDAAGAGGREPYVAHYRGSDIDTRLRDVVRTTLGSEGQ